MSEEGGGPQIDDLGQVLCFVGGLIFGFPFFSFGIDELRAERLNVSESRRVGWKRRMRNGTEGRVAADDRGRLRKCSEL